MTATSIDRTMQKTTVGIIWSAQALGAAAFLVSGVMKLLTPIETLSAQMAWVGQHPEGLVRLLGAVDLAGGVGLVLPSLLRIAPGLTPLAALGCIVLQICAAAFHLSRGEASLLPINAVYFALAGVVLWGRGSRAPVAPRWL